MTPFMEKSIRPVLGRLNIRKTDMTVKAKERRESAGESPWYPPENSCGKWRGYIQLLRRAGEKVPENKGIAEILT